MLEHNPPDDKEQILSKQLLNHLTLIKSNFSFGLQFWALLGDPNTAEGLQVHRVVIKADGIYAIPPDKSIDIPEGEEYYTLELGGPEKRNFEHASLEFVKLHLRVFVVDTFEKLKAYCESTDKVSAFKDSEWYQFTRIVRNSLTHDQNWRFNKYDKSVLPVTWNEKTIEINMDNTEMTWEFFDPFDALELWDEMYEFAESIIS